MENKKNKIIIISLIVAIVLCIGAITFIIVKHNINNKKGNTIENNPVVTTSKYRMSGNNIEDFDLFFLKLENNKENMTYSPLSIKYALAMLNEGAVGETNDQIKAVIGDYKANKYENSSNMSLANALFVKDTEKDNIKEQYKTNLENKFNAEVIYDSFENPNNINNWVKNKTFGLVNHLFDDVSDKMFALVNALAIDMDWVYQIQARSTYGTNGKQYDYLLYAVNYYHTTYSDHIGLISEGGKFKKIKFGENQIEVPAAQIGATINKYNIVSTLGKENIKKTVGAEYDRRLANNGAICYSNMTKEAILEQYVTEIDKHYNNVQKSTDFEFYTDNDVKVFAKDLKEYDGRTLQYIGIMPTNTELNNYISGIDSNKISRIINNLKTIDANSFEDGYVYKITGYIPFFKYDYDLDLTGDLKKLGITNVFDPNRSDLSKLSSMEGTYIGETKHKTTIQFSNEGIKAAAATGFGGLGAAGCDLYQYELPVKVIDLTFDKPYMYLIRDKKTGEIWFMGTVYNPSIEE